MSIIQYLTLQVPAAQANQKSYMYTNNDVKILLNKLLIVNGPI